MERIEEEEQPESVRIASYKSLHGGVSARLSYHSMNRCDQYRPVILNHSRTTLVQRRWYAGRRPGGSGEMTYLTSGILDMTTRALTPCGQRWGAVRHQSWTFRDTVRPVGVEIALDPHAGWIDGWNDLPYQLLRLVRWQRRGGRTSRRRCPRTSPRRCPRTSPRRCPRTSRRRCPRTSPRCCPRSSPRRSPRTSRRRSPSPPPPPLLVSSSASSPRLLLVSSSSNSSSSSSSASVSNSSASVSSHAHNLLLHCRRLGPSLPRGGEGMENTAIGITLGGCRGRGNKRTARSPPAPLAGEPWQPTPAARCLSIRAASFLTCVA